MLLSTYTYIYFMNLFKKKSIIPIITAVYIQIVLFNRLYYNDENLHAFCLHNEVHK